MSGYTQRDGNTAVMEAQPIRVLHLLGSATSEFYFDLSIMYGRTCANCEDLDRTNFSHEYAIVYSNGEWGFPEMLNDEAVKATANETMPIGVAMARIEAMQPPVDVVVPHMFCVQGMTQYRSLCSMLGLEVLGNSGYTCTIGNDKYLTKQVCKVAGVPVPDGEMLRKDTHGADMIATATDLLTRRGVPMIVKPAKEDNSIGLSLVKIDSVDAVAEALANAFEHDDTILVEQYIAGRECRVGVLEVEDTEGNIHLKVLPKLEYVLEDIRTMKHKLGTDSNGKLLTSDENPGAAIAKAKEEGERICPAQFDEATHARLDDLALRAHKALGCKYYSLYDARIDKDGFPYMLEAALFCSFSPLSVIVGLSAQCDDENLKPHPKVFEMLLRRAAQETRRRRQTKGSNAAVQKTGALRM